MMHCSIMVPSHITGFFEIVEHQNPLCHGSRGAGVALEDGVLTVVKISPGDGKVSIRTKGSEDTTCSSITHKTLEIIKKKFSEGLNLDQKRIDIEHSIKLPIGAGFGISAATALGTALTLSRLLELPLTYYQAASLAHLAELELQSGLGDVIAETCGGLVIRRREGAPGVGVVDRIITGMDDEDELFVLSKSLGQIETSSVITSPQHKQRINQVGSALLSQLMENPTPTEFMRLSRRFAEETGLMDPEIREIVEIMDEDSLGASMAMLGKTAFAISKTPDSNVEGIMASRINYYGCRFL